MAQHKIEMDNATQRFFQGAASATKVNDEHADTPFPDQQTRINLFWFYVGAVAAGEHGCTSAEDFTNFALGANTRAPRPVVDDTADDTDH